MNYRELIKQLVTILASFFFTFLVGKYPDFPLDQQTFINLILWVVSLTGIIGVIRIFNNKN